MRQRQGWSHWHSTLFSTEQAARAYIEKAAGPGCDELEPWVLLRLDRREVGPYIPVPDQPDGAVGVDTGEHEALGHDDVDPLSTFVAGRWVWRVAWRRLGSDRAQVRYVMSRPKVRRLVSVVTGDNPQWAPLSFLEVTRAPLGEWAACPDFPQLGAE